jgi:hypothetical protein
VKIMNRFVSPRVASLSLSLLVLPIAGCVTPGGTLQEAGSVTVFGLQLESSLDWARMKTGRGETWTIDGTALNLLGITANVAPDEHVFQGRRRTERRPDGPWYRAGMRPDEIRDIVLDGLREGGWANLASTNLRPATFGEVEGLRFDFTMDRESGLRYAGTAAALEREGRLTVLVWYAPMEHYHPRDVASVNVMLDTLRPLQQR